MNFRKLAWWLSWFRRLCPARSSVRESGLFSTAFLLGLVLYGCNARSSSPQSASPSPKPDTAETSASQDSGSPISFVDVTQQAGIQFRHNSGAFGAKWTLETIGSGVAFIDYDSDGYQDIFFVNGRDWTQAEIDAYSRGIGREHSRKYGFVLPEKKAYRRTTAALYRNNRDGSFTDVTRNSGLEVEIYGMGAAVGDYDNDGRPDLLVTSMERNFLFHNEGNGRFRDVSASVGLKDAHLSTCAAWLDYDRDGRLDIFIGQYINWHHGNDYYQIYRGMGGIGLKAMSGPEYYKGQLVQLYHNEGNGTFREVASKAGLHESRQGKKTEILRGKALGVTILDYNSDRWPDIMVANDRHRNFLFQNKGNGTFVEIAEKVGVAYSKFGEARAGMGIDAGDIDQSNRESVLVTNFSTEMLALYRNLGSGIFDDMAPNSILGRASHPFLGFGCALADFDNDGWLDILVTNGHVNDLVMEKANQPALLFHNQGSTAKSRASKGLPAVFKDVSSLSGSALQKRVMGRGLACGDIDLDGDLDVVISVNNSVPMLLRNDSAPNNAIRVILRSAKGNRDAIGAVVWAKIGEELIRRRVRSGSSYLSQNELPITLGLGKARRADVLVRWPSGKLTNYKNVDANQIITVSENGQILKRQKLHRQ